MDYVQYFTEAVTAVKGALDVVRGVQAVLPKEKADAVAAELGKAEVAVKQSQAELAKGLGFRLCRCEFPPNIMLWKADIKKNVCPKCADKYPPDLKPQPVKPNRFGGVT